MFRLAVICGLLALCNARHFDNPVLDGADYPDPGVILKDGVYYAVTTTNNDAYEKYPIHTSTNLQDWAFAGYIFNQTNLPKWSKNTHEFWAPEIHEINGEYRLYFTSRDTETDILVIGVASSKNILGPYTSPDKALLVRLGTWCLDSTVIKNNETLALAWVESLYIRTRKLSPDGLSFAEPESTPLIHPELPWEGETTEGPWYIQRNGYHYLFYSGNNFCSDGYALGVARSRSVTGPYEKLPEPLLVSNDQFKGPGHGSIVRDIVNDGWVFVHHGWRAGAVCGDNNRLMFSTSMEWGDDDWPKKMSIGN